MTFVETLGWVLLHFAWQGAVAALLLWMALLVTPSARDLAEANKVFVAAEWPR